MSLNKYIDINDLPQTPTSQIHNVIALDINGDVIISPLQSDVSNIENNVSDIEKNIEDINAEITEVKESIPTKTSELTNDSDYATNANVNGEIGNLDNSLSSKINEKQDILVSGENIKTINNQSLLGEGNIEIIGGGGSITIDDALSATSTNAVQNKIITNKINDIEAIIGNINNVLTQING